MQGEVPTVGAIAAAGRGEAWAVEEIATTLQRFARHVCAGNRRSGDAPELAWEDIAQEASRRFFASGVRQFSGVGREGSYLYSIVKSTWIDLARRSFRRRRREESQTPEDELVTPPSLDLRMKVESILTRLAGECREILVQVFLDGRSYADLAVTTGLAESSLRARVSRCIRRARELST